MTLGWALSICYVLIAMTIAAPLPASHWFNGTLVWGNGMFSGPIAIPAVSLFIWGCTQDAKK